MSLTDICRLCSSENNLVWVFHKKFGNTDTMKNLIYITTGVEIRDTDAVSQKICEKCCHVTINVFQFRKKSLENDRLLKEKLRSLKSDDGDLPANFLPAKDEIKEKEENIRTELKQKGTERTNPTAEELFQLHPHLKLPRINLRMGEVEKYFKNQKWDFDEQCRLALPQNLTAEKTSILAKETSESPPCLIDGKIIRQETDDWDQDVIRPIKIRIIPKINVEITEKGPARQETEKTAQCHSHRKRKWLDGAESSTKENEEAENVERCIEDPRSLKTEEYDTPEDIKRHRGRPFRCKFCQTTFQSRESRNEHLESQCPIKEMVGRFPTIGLRRIETDIDIVKRYPKAFAPLDLQNNETDKSPDYQVDVIEILSDDDDEDVPAKTEPKPAPTKVSEINPKVTLKGLPSIMEVVGPKFSELVALKNLLIRYKPPRMSTEKNIQTDSPDMQDIQVNDSNKTAVFNDLKHQLHVFQVPVEIQNGPFGVSYKLSNQPKSKNLQLWDELTAVDIENNKTRVAAAAAATQSNRRVSTPKEAQTANEVNKLTASRPVTVEKASLQSVDTVVSTCLTHDENYNSFSSADVVVIQSLVDKPVSSTHESSAVSTFPSGSKTAPFTSSAMTANQLYNLLTAQEAPTVANAEAVKSVHPSDHVPKKMRILAPAPSTSQATPTVKDKLLANVPTLLSGSRPAVSSTHSSTPGTEKPLSPSGSLRFLRPVKFKIPQLPNKVPVHPNNIFKNTRHDGATASSQSGNNRATSQTVSAYRPIPPVIIDSQSTSTRISPMKQQSSSSTYWPPSSDSFQVPVNAYKPVHSNGTFWPVVTASLPPSTCSFPNPAATRSTNLNTPGRFNAQSNSLSNPPPHSQHVNSATPTNVLNFTQSCQPRNSNSISGVNLQTVTCADNLFDIETRTSFLNNRSTPTNVEYVWQSDPYQNGHARIVSVASSSSLMNTERTPQQLGHIRVKNMRELT